jgi:hypothetical protein
MYPIISARSSNDIAEGNEDGEFGFPIIRLTQVEVSDVRPLSARCVSGRVGGPD